MTEKPNQPLDADAIKPEVSTEILEEKIKHLEESIQEKEDTILRNAAELQNITQRLRREIDQTRSFAITQLVQNIIPCLDAFDSALSSFKEEDNAHKQGIEMIKQQFMTALSQSGVSTVKPEANTPYDPKQHEAIQMMPHPDYKPQMVIECVQVGYSVKDRVIRPARVIVVSNQN
ncbi:MAG: nucleotide exchange factor GrpE [Candidatus Comchoanobacterales bacterium]